MHVSVRQYRTSDIGEVARRVEGDDCFLGVVREVPGFTAYYLVDAGDGNLMTITVAEDQAGVEESVTKASEWVRDHAAELVEGTPTVTNGEVVANT